MRLFEVANKYIDDLETVIRNLVGRSDSKDTSQHLSYQALSNIMKNMGYGMVNFEDFSRIYDENPTIQTLVKDFNNQGITLGTHSDIEQDAQTSAVPGGKTVDQMAHRAVKREF